MSDWGYLGQGLSEAAKTVGPLYLGHLLQGERDVKLDKMQLRRDDILGKQAIALQKERIDVDKVLQTERLTAQSEEAKLGREFTDKDPSGFVTAKDLVKVSKGELAKMSAEERAKLVSEAKVSTQAEIDKYNREHAGAVELKKMELEKGSVISKKEFDAGLRKVREKMGSNLDADHQKLWEKAAGDSKKERLVLVSQYEANGLRVVGFTEKPAPVDTPEKLFVTELAKTNPDLVAKAQFNDKKAQAKIKEMFKAAMTAPAAPAVAPVAAPAPAIKKVPMTGLYEPPTKPEQGLLQTPIGEAASRVGKKALDFVGQEGFLNKKFKDLTY